MASSIGASLRLAVIRAFPMPSVIDPEPVDLSVPLRTYSNKLLPGGSTSTQRTARRRDFRYSATPAKVPPVPVEATNASIRPPVCAQISGPVVRAWVSRLAVLSNWLDQTEFGSDAARRCATFWYWLGLL